MMGGEETDVQFNCTIHKVLPEDDATLWLREEPDGSWFEIFSNFESMVDENKYGIEGTHNLVIKNVDLSDGRAYSCKNSVHDGDDSLAKVVSQLIVLGE